MCVDLAVGECMDFFVFSAQFFYKPKTVLKYGFKLYNKKN